VWTTGQQHIAMPRLIQPQALAGMDAWRTTPQFCHRFISLKNMWKKYKYITVNKKPKAKTNQSPIVSTAHWIRL
jgi:hypothetical protein